MKASLVPVHPGNGPTLLNEQGWHPHLIGLQLAHAERNKVRAAYNRGEPRQAADIDASLGGLPGRAQRSTA
jgi:hypothetical protein